MTQPRRAIYKFNSAFQLAIFKALGLENRRIRRLIITMEVDKPITLQIDEYATLSTGEPYLLANLLELSKFESPTTTTTTKEN